MAAGSYGAGATPWTDPNAPPFAAGFRQVSLLYAAGLAGWLLGGLMVTGAWWLLGRLVRSGEVSGRWMVSTAVLWALPAVLSAPIGSRDIYAYACQGLLYVAGFNPYQVGPAVLHSPWLQSMSSVWQHSPAPYGPLAMLLSGLAAAASGGHLLLALAWLRLTAIAGVVLIAVFLPRLAVACGVYPAAAIWLGLASPLVSVQLLSGAHHDALAVGLMLAGLDCATRRRSLPAGLAFGLAVAVKATAVVAIPFAVVLVAAGLAGSRRLLRAGAAVALPAAAMFLAVTVISGLGFGWIHATPGANAIIHWLSAPTAVGLVAGELLRAAGVTNGVHIGVVAARSLALYAVLPVILVVLWWRIRRSTDTRRIITQTGWAAAAAVLLSPLVYPWYFAAPVAILAIADPRPQIRTALAAISVLGLFVILPDGFNLARATMWPGAFAEVIGIVLILVLFATHARRRRRIPTRLHS
jgi:hypothetical protein